MLCWCVGVVVRKCIVVFVCLCMCECCVSPAFNDRILVQLIAVETLQFTDCNVAVSFLPISRVICLFLMLSVFPIYGIKFPVRIYEKNTSNPSQIDRNGARERSWKKSDSREAHKTKFGAGAGSFLSHVGAVWPILADFWDPSKSGWAPKTTPKI